MSNLPRNKKKGIHFRNRRINIHNTPVKPKVSAGFTPTSPSPKPKRFWPPLNNEKEFPSLGAKTITPLILSPIDQVLGCWAYDSMLPPPEVLMEKIKTQTKDPIVQFDPENDPCEVSLHQLIKMTKLVHQTQRDILDNLVDYKKCNVIPNEFLFKSLIKFVNESKFLVTLCKHVK